MKPAFLAMAFLSALLLQSCYLWNQGWTLLGIYGSGRPLAEWLGQPDLSPEERLLLERVIRLRAFAAGELGLKLGENYSRYVQAPREYLVDVVQAAGEFSVEPYLWTYPVVGALPYQGYFDRAEAEAEAQRLKDQGYEVLIRPVDAFSTLGWFADPVFSFFKDYDEALLADLIFHESTHATLFLPGQASFNEALATVVGRAGARQWMEAQGPQAAEAFGVYEARLADAAVFAGLLAQLREERAALFRLRLAPEEIRRRRAEMTEAWLTDFRARYSERFTTDAYRAFGERTEVSNALLALYATYEEPRPLLKERLAAHGGQIRPFLAELLTIPRDHPDPWAWVEALPPLAPEASPP